jgi:PAS domain S-box-containing protein
VKKSHWNFDLNDFYKILEGATNLVGLFNSSGQIQAVNPAWSRALGFSESELLEKNIFSMVIPKDLEKTQRAFESGAEGQSIQRLENAVLAQNGELRCLSWNITPFPSRQLLFCSVQDVTLARRQEDEKNKTDRILRRTIDSLPIIVAYLDHNLNYRFKNAAYENWVGPSAKDLRNTNLLEEVGEESASKMRRHRQLAILTGQVQKFEITFQNHHNEKRFLDVQYHPYRNGAGEIEGLMVLGFDTTEIREAQQAIQTTENKLQSVLNEANVGIWEKNHLTGIFTISENFRRWMGIPDGVVVQDENFLAAVHPDDRAILLESQKILTQKRKSIQVEYRFRWKNENYIHILGTGNPLFDEPAGRMVGAMGIFIDISKRKQMEQTLQAQQFKMMNSSRLSALGEMAGGVAHEINNPLAIILSYAESLKMSASRDMLTPDMVDKTTGKIKATVMRIAKIIQSLRTLSRDSEQDPFEFVTVRRMIEDTLEFCSQRFLDHEIRLEVDNEIGDLSLYARPTQISQILLNLLNNAHDAVEKSQERWVRVSAQDVVDSIEISVTDSGPGIPLDIREKIFDPFFTTKGPNKGTGLGLSVSRSMIQSHGGTLRLNARSKQTQFVLTIPKNLKNFPIL